MLNIVSTENSESLFYVTLSTFQSVTILGRVLVMIWLGIYHKFKLSYL